MAPFSAYESAAAVLAENASRQFLGAFFLIGAEDTIWQRVGYHHADVLARCRRNQSGCLVATPRTMSRILVLRRGFSAVSRLGCSGPRLALLLLIRCACDYWCCIRSLLSSMRVFRPSILTWSFYSVYFRVCASSRRWQCPLLHLRHFSEVVWWLLTALLSDSVS